MCAVSRTVAVVAALVAVAGCSATPEPASSPSPSQPAATFTVRGNLALAQTTLNRNTADPSCAGRGGYSDIRNGAQVKISDASGKIVALGELEDAFAVQMNEGMPGTSHCVLYFKVEGVPDGGSMYGIEVSHRGVVQFARDEIEDVSLNLGD